MNRKGIGLIFISLTLLSGCFPTGEQTALPKPEKNPVYTAKADPSSAANLPKGTQQKTKPSATILELYKNWKGPLICNDRSYDPGSTIFYNGEVVDCEIQLDSVKGLNTATEDLQMLEEKYVSAEVEGLRQSQEHFDLIDFYVFAARPNLIEFRIQPAKQPLKIIFKTNTGQMDFKFEYAETATYTVSRPFTADGSLYATGIRQYLQTGKSHIYNIAFFQAMDKVSVEQRLDEQLPGIRKQVKWLSDHSLTLTLQPEKKDLMKEYEEYRLNLTGVKTRKGLANNDWQGNQTVRIQPTYRKYFNLNSLLTGEKKPLFNSLIAYSSLDVSPNGKWILAEELNSNQAVLNTSYSLLDLSGERLKELQVYAPIWLPDGNSLLFSDYHSVMRYDISTGEKRVIWSDSKEPAILSYEYDRVSGRLLVAAGHSDNKGGVPIDLILFDSVIDAHPRQLKNVLHNREEEAWHGLHYSLPVDFIGDGLVYLESSLPPDGQSGENQRVRFVMDWKSGKSRSLDKKGVLYPLNEGKMLHQENGKWTVYDAVSGLETPLHITVGDDAWLTVKAIRKGMILLSVSTDKQYLLNLNTLSLQPIPGDLHILSNSAWQGEVVTAKLSD